MRTCRTWILCERMHTGKPDGPDAEKDAVAVFAVCSSTGDMDCGCPPQRYHPDDSNAAPFLPMNIFLHAFTAGREKSLCGSITVEAA